MHLNDFDFTRPEDLIAQYPLPERSASRLLHLDSPSARTDHLRFSQLPDLLHPNDLLVFNNTKVIPARLYGKKSTGGRVEFLIERNTEPLDRTRYQTIFADKEGAVAAPTAGLHFDAALMQRLHAKGIRTAQITLHVGAGTFQPIRTEQVTEHKIHQEYVEVPESVCTQIQQTRQQGGRAILEAYQEAIAQKYRFFSYGDAMLLTAENRCSNHR